MYETCVCCVSRLRRVALADWTDCACSCRAVSLCVSTSFDWGSHRPPCYLPNSVQILHRQIKGRFPLPSKSHRPHNVSRFDRRCRHQRCASCFSHLCDCSACYFGCSCCRSCCYCHALCASTAARRRSHLDVARIGRVYPERTVAGLRWREVLRRSRAMVACCSGSPNAVLQARRLLCQP